MATKHTRDAMPFPECLKGMDKIAYHPDPEIDAEVRLQAIEAEKLDLAAGYPPRRWVCTCGASHSRGHFFEVGVHRCLQCGEVGTHGVMMDEAEWAEYSAALSHASEH